MNDERTKAAAMMLDHMGAAEHAATVRDMAAELERLRESLAAWEKEAATLAEERNRLRADAERREAASIKLCGIYFDIAAAEIGEDEVIRRRDAAIDAARGE